MSISIIVTVYCVGNGMDKIRYEKDARAYTRREVVNKQL